MSNLTNAKPVKNPSTWNQIKIGMRRKIAGSNPRTGPTLGTSEYAFQETRAGRESCFEIVLINSFASNFSGAK